MSANVPASDKIAFELRLSQDSYANTLQGGLQGVPETAIDFLWAPTAESAP